MNESSFIKMPAREVLDLCEAKLAEARTGRQERVVRWAGYWRATWRSRIALAFGFDPLTDEDAARRWAKETYHSLNPWWLNDVHRLHAAALAGHDMLLSIDDFDLLSPEG